MQSTRPKDARDQQLPPDCGLPKALQTLLFWGSPFRYLEQCRSRYGERFTLNAIDHPPLVMLSDLADIKGVLADSTNALHAGIGGRPIEPIVGSRSFMLADEAQHLHDRRAILPAFRADVIQQQRETITRIVERHVKAWPRERAFSLHPHLRELSLEIILCTLAGWPANHGDIRLDALRDKLLQMLTVTASPLVSAPFLRRGPGRLAWDRFLRTRFEADELIYALLDETDSPLAHGSSVLNGLLGAAGAAAPSSRERLRDNIMSIVLAGHETTAAQLAWVFQLLTRHPAILTRLNAELARAEGQEYLTAVIREVLRHRPVFLFAIPRAVTQFIQLGEWTYRPPAQLLACIYLVHHDQKVYPHPHEFRPERFLEQPPEPSAWMPWGGGSRRCPGLHLAMLEMKTVIRTVLSTTTVHAAHPQLTRPRWRSVIVAPYSGPHIVLRRRNRRPHVGH